MKGTQDTKYDLISIGRCGVDLYSNQLGDGLRDALSFNKYVGGCPANIAIGTARQGLRVAMLTRVGKEQMGDYLIKTFADEGVDPQFIRRDRDRLTTLVLLSIRDAATFPLLYYRQNCADMGLCQEDILAAPIGESKAILISGVHLSTPHTAQALFKAVELAREAGTQVIFDIDYRPVLWGLTELGEGENRFVANQEVTANVQRILPMCDLIVGTDEEFNIASGSEEPLISLTNIRKLTPATFVFKMGAEGCCVIEGEVPQKLTPNGKAFSVEIVNSVGAGDAFMSGFLSAYLRGEDWESCATRGNASGALVVSRHGCSPESPSMPELEFFMQRRSELPPIPDQEPAFRRLHNATTGAHRPGKGDSSPQDLCILAFDHRLQFEEMVYAINPALNSDNIAQAKGLIWEAFKQANQQAAASFKLGLICDSAYGKDVLLQATGEGIWIGRPVEKPKSYPLEFDFSVPVSQMIESFPASHLVKCLFFYKSDEDEALRQRQIEQLSYLYQACEHSRHRLLLEVLPTTSLSGEEESREILCGMQEVYQNKIFPDWWKLPGLTATAWDQVGRLIEQKDQYCCGVVLLGQDKPREQLNEEMRLAAKHKICRGFAIGRSIFGAPISSWFKGTKDADETISLICKNFLHFIDAWTKASQVKSKAS